VQRRQAVLRLASAGATALAAPARSARADRPLRIGLTAVILADQAAFLARWSEHLSQRLGSHVTFVARDQYQPIHDLLFDGQIDAAWTCGYPFVRFRSQLRLLAVPLYRGRPMYESYLIRPLTPAGQAPKVSGWRDLRDKVFAFSDPLSNSGWLVAQAQLAAAGIAATELRRAFFAHGHRNVAEAVSARLAHAGAIDGYVWETMRLQRMPAALRTEVVWKSAPYGFPPLVTTARASHPGLQDLQSVLLAMGQDEAGRGLLKALNLDGFVAGEPAWFDSIRTLALTVPRSGVVT
jgi:phosphonate transport system substrate-binding protein